MSGKDLPIIETRFGEILGEEKFLKDAVERFDLRKNDYGEEMKRIEDRFSTVICEFEQKIGNEIEDINVNSHKELACPLIPFGFWLWLI